MNFLKISLEIYNFPVRIPFMVENICSNIDDFLKYLETRGRSQNTLVNYSVDLNQFAEYLEKQGITDASEIDSDSVRVFLSNIIGINMAKSSASRKLSAVRGFVKWLGSRNIIQKKDIALGLKGP